MVEGQENLASWGESLTRIDIFIEKYGGKGVLKDGSSVVWMCYFLLVLGDSRIKLDFHHFLGPI